MGGLLYKSLNLSGLISIMPKTWRVVGEWVDKPNSVQSLSCVRLFVTPWTAARQASPSITNSQSFLKLMSMESVIPSNHLIPCHSLLLLPSIFPSNRVFSNSWFFASGGQSIGVSASASVLPMNIQGWFPLGLTGWISLQSKGLQDSQESSPTPQFKSINSSVLSLLYSTTLTSIHDDWKNQSFDQMDLCWQSNVSAFNTLSRLVITFFQGASLF